MQDLRFGVHPDKQRLVVELDRVPMGYRAFSLQNPARLVIDLPQFSWGVSDVQNVKNSRVDKIRQGVLEPGISRIVLDLKGNSEIYNAYTLPPTSGTAHRLVIDFGAVKNPANLNKRFGTLATASNTTRIKRPTTPPPPQSTPTKKQSAMYKPLVVIDAGHGGVDPGAVSGKNIYEKYITLAIAKKLAASLDGTGRYRTHLTRDDDRFIKLYERVKIAQRHNADLFISIHADSIESRSVRGISVYTLSDKASDAQTAKLAARENRADLIGGVDLSTEDVEVANILLDLARRDTMNQSKFFANMLVDTFQSQSLRTLKTPHRYAGFAVLKAPDIPAVLIETGFLSNYTEAQNLMKPDYQKRVANTIRLGIDSYFDRLAQTQ